MAKKKKLLLLLKLLLPLLLLLLRLKLLLLLPQLLLLPKKRSNLDYFDSRKSRSCTGFFVVCRFLSDDLPPVESFGLAGHTNPFLRTAEHHT